jgi:hypothetical protein
MGGRCRYYYVVLGRVRNGVNWELLFVIYFAALAGVLIVIWVISKSNCSVYALRRRMSIHASCLWGRGVSFGYEPYH